MGRQTEIPQVAAAEGDVLEALLKSIGLDEQRAEPVWDAWTTGGLPAARSALQKTIGSLIDEAIPPPRPPEPKPEPEGRWDPFKEIRAKRKASTR